VELDPDIVIRGHGAAVDLPFIPQQRSDLQQLAELARRGFAPERRPSEVDVDTAFPGQPA
jgi:hypothetical protein